MGVVTNYALSYPNPTNVVRAPAAYYADLGLRTLIAPFTITNGDEANSLIYFASLPSHARLHPTSLIHHGSVTSLTDFDIGIDADLDCLADGLNLSSAGTKSVMASVAIADLHKPLWQIAGLTKDPGRNLDIYGTLKGTAGATIACAAVINFCLER